MLLSMAHGGTSMNAINIHYMIDMILLSRYNVIEMCYEVCHMGMNVHVNIHYIYVQHDFNYKLK